MREGLGGKVDGECWVEKTGDNEVGDEDDTNLILGAVAGSRRPIPRK